MEPVNRTHCANCADHADFPDRADLVNRAALAGRADLAGHRIPRLGMGTMALAIEGRPSRDTAIATIHAALDAGVRYLDTAWSYYLPTAPGASGTGVPGDFGYGERLVRDALASWGGPRDEVLVATKTGYRRTISAMPASKPTPVPESAVGDDAGAADAARAAAGTVVSDGGGMAVGAGAADAARADSPDDAGVSHVSAANASDGNATEAAGADADLHAASARQRLQAAGSRYGWMADSRPETMIRDAKESALRLGVDALDLLYSHGPDPAVPYEETIGALCTLLDEGVIRFAGISRVDNVQIDIAHAMLGDRLVAVQNQFSPSHPDPERTMAHCAQLGLAFVCWSPLGGFLDPVDMHAYDAFREVAAARGVSYQRVVLAWELTRYGRLFSIPSARNPHEVRDSFAAIDLRLSLDELAALDAAVGVEA